MVNPKGSTLLAIAVAGIFVMQGMKSLDALKLKTAAQDNITERLERWSQSYLALRESRDRWNKNFRRIDTVKDYVAMVSLIGLEAYGLSTDPDSFTLTKPLQSVFQNGTELGLAKICVGTGSGDGGDLIVQAPDYLTLLNGIERLVKRPDVHLGNISIQGDKPRPVARLGDFCLLLRTV